MRLALCGGGTGGHVYPALAIAAALEAAMGAEPAAGQGRDQLELLYLGTVTGQERELVERAGISLRAVSAGPIRGRSPIELIANAAKMGFGTLEARKALEKFGAEVVLSTGGYTSFPVALAAYSKKRLPLVVYLPDVHPGWSVQVMARLAQRLAVSTTKTLSKLPDGKAIVTGYPVRPAFWQTNRAEGRQRLGIDPEEKLLFIAGASQGAQTINTTIAANLRGVLELCEVIHLSGRGDEPALSRLRDELPQGLKERYHLFGYLHEEVPWAMAAADLAVCRAGASVIGELPAVGLPAVLVPYPYAGSHQRHNARYLEENGAAVVVENADLPREFLPLVGELLSDEPRLRSLAEAARRLARPEAASNVARLVLEAAASR